VTYHWVNLLVNAHFVRGVNLLKSMPLHMSRNSDAREPMVIRWLPPEGNMWLLLLAYPAW
jgi:hypothetical protein